jgi:hypothetical protein
MDPIDDLTNRLKHYRMQAATVVQERQGDEEVKAIKSIHALNALAIKSRLLVPGSAVVMGKLYQVLGDSSKEIDIEKAMAVVLKDEQLVKQLGAKKVPDDVQEEIDALKAERGYTDADFERSYKPSDRFCYTKLRSLGDDDEVEYVVTHAVKEGHLELLVKLKDELLKECSWIKATEVMEDETCVSYLRNIDASKDLDARMASLLDGEPFSRIRWPHNFFFV